MSDDLAANDLAATAASWVPPWQRPAGATEPDAESEADGESDISDRSDDADLLAGEYDAASADDLESGDAVQASAVEAGEADVAEEGEAGEVGEVAEVEDCWTETADAEEDSLPPEDAAESRPERWTGLADARWHSVSREEEDETQPQVAVPGQRESAEKTRPAPEPEPEVLLPAISDADLPSALEAILMVVDEPVGEITLAQVLDIPAERVANALIDLSASYTHDGRGFDLRRAAGGWRYYTRSDYASYVERFVLDGQQLRLTQASLETLAVVAYKQPVTRSRISAIRGVNCDGVVRTLVTRGMIEECGTEPETGAHLYRTTNLFLEKLGLDSVDQLPPLAPFLPDNLDEVAGE